MTSSENIYLESRIPKNQSSRHQIKHFAFLILFFQLSWASSAYAQNDPRELPDVPAPPSIPDLTHRGIWIGYELNVASVKSHDTAERPSYLSAHGLSRIEIEAAFYDRHLYVGAAYENAYAKSLSEGDYHFLWGYPEIWLRATYSSRSGLAYGGGLSATLPIFQRSPDSESAQASETIRIIRPWDFAVFADNTYTLFPYLDARVVDGPVVFQLRQGIAFQGQIAQARLPDTSAISKTTLYVGYQPIESLGIGLELWEVYFVSSNIPDEQRAAFAISPSVRFLSRRFQPSISAIFPFEQPIFDRAESYWALRFNVGIILDK